MNAAVYFRLSAKKHLLPLYYNGRRLSKHRFQLDFFSAGDNGCEVMEGERGVLFVNKTDGRATGDAFVLFASEADAQKVDHTLLIFDAYRSKQSTLLLSGAHKAQRHYRHALYRVVPQHNSRSTTSRFNSPFFSRMHGAGRLSTWPWKWRLGWDAVRTGLTSDSFCNPPRPRGPVVWSASVVRYATLVDAD